MKKIENKDTKRSQMYYFARYSGLAFEMLGIIVLGAFAGYKLDEKRAADFPLWTVVLSLSAVAASLYLVIKKLLNK